MSSKIYYNVQHDLRLGVISMSSIAENIKKLRESHGWSKAELARMIGKTRPAISQYESGQTIPRMGTIEDLARVFGVNKRDIIESRIEYGVVDMRIDDEIELVELYRKLSTQGKHALLAGLRDYVGDAQ